MGWLIFVIVASIAITAAVLYGTTLGPLIDSWLYKKPPPSSNKTPKNIDPPELPEEQPTPPTAPPSQEVEKPAPPAPPPTVAPSVKKVPEYLGNSNTMEIHDLSNIKPTCQFDRINEENKVFFDKIEEVKKAIESKGYDGCRWCLTKYHTD